MDKRVFNYYRGSLKEFIPVIAVQGDDDKIIAAYDDGSLICWDRKTGSTNFELQGRSNMISSLQFDKTRYVNLFHLQF